MAPRSSRFVRPGTISSHGKVERAALDHPPPEGQFRTTTLHRVADRRLRNARPGWVHTGVLRPLSASDVGGHNKRRLLASRLGALFTGADGQLSTRRWVAGVVQLRNGLLAAVGEGLESRAAR
jgi:hypothetical protein